MLNKKSLYTALSLGAFLVCGPIAALETQSASTEKTAPAVDVDIKKLSEAFGNFIGKNLKTSGLNFDIDSLISGIKAGSDGKPSPLSEQEYEKGMMALQERAIKRLADDNLQAAEKFMKENAGKANIVVVEPGKLQYEVLKQGTGKAVAEHSAPSIAYKGQYIDGTVFGSSDDAGGPITLPLDQTIPGFAKAIVGMKEGEKRKLFVHPDLGYGTSGQLPPNSLLIFEVEVLKANDADRSDDDDDVKAAPLAENDAMQPKKDKGAKTDSKDSKDSDDDSDDDDDDDDSDDDYDDDDDNNDDDTPAAKTKDAAKTPEKK